MSPARPRSPCSRNSGRVQRRRGSLAIKTAEQGSGLGLPIVKGLIDLHNGGFHLKSKPRAGTEVTITLPAERVMDTLAALPQPEERAA